MTEYLVTGGAGFIGSNIVETLVGAGESVRVLDNFSSGKRENVAPFLGAAEVVEGDLRRPDDVRRAVEGVRYVLHQGAIPSVPRSVEDPVSTLETNVTGTLNLLIAARDAAVERVVFASSSSVYGEAAAAEAACATKRSFVQATRSVAQLPKRESMRPDPLSPYAASKLIGEYYCALFHRLHGLEVVVLRYFNVFGPRQDPASAYAAVVPAFIASLVRGVAPEIHGDGLQTRDFTYVADVVQANLLACKAPREAVGEVFNIACHRQITILALFQAVREAAGPAAAGIEPRHTAPRPGDVRDSFADISRAREILGYAPRWSLAEGLAKTVEHFARSA